MVRLGKCAFIGDHGGGWEACSAFIFRLLIHGNCRRIRFLVARQKIGNIDPFGGTGLLVVVFGQWIYISSLDSAVHAPRRWPGLWSCT